MARAFIWVTVCIFCASMTAVAFADPQTEETPKAVNGQAGGEDFAARAADQFTAQTKQYFEAQEAKKRNQEIAKINSSLCAPPSSGSILNADDFGKAVICALSKTVPERKGKIGYTVVRFVVSEAGRPGRFDVLTVDQTSGDYANDQAALLAVSHASIPVPPAGLSLGERTFVVQYLAPY